MMVTNIVTMYQIKTLGVVVDVMEGMTVEMEDVKDDDCVAKLDLSLVEDNAKYEIKEVNANLNKDIPMEITVSCVTE